MCNSNAKSQKVGEKCKLLLSEESESDRLTSLRKVLHEYVQFKRVHGEKKTCPIWELIEIKAAAPAHTF